MELWEGKFSHEEVQSKIAEYEEDGKNIPMMGMGDQGGMVVSDFFKPERKIQRTKPFTEEQKKKRDETLKQMHESLKNSINIRKLMDPHGFEFYSLYRLRSLLVQLKAEYTTAELRPEFQSKFNRSAPKQESVSNIQPINWLKGKESLRLFIEELKSTSLIENRETEEIIQEHFGVGYQEAEGTTKPLVWLSDNKYLAYLIHRVTEEFLIRVKDNKHKLTASHFVSRTGQSLKASSLASQLSQVLKYEKSSNNNIQIIESILDKVKS